MDRRRRRQHRPNPNSPTSSPAADPTKTPKSSLFNSVATADNPRSVFDRRNRGSSSNPSSSRSTHIQENLKSHGEETDEEETSSIPSLIGTCPFMCPEGERVQRERLRDLAVFERLHGNPGRTSPSLAVKKFCRTISTKYAHASDLRPIPVLEDTLSHLLNLLECTDHPFEVVHDFISDRTRSIRQDLSMQNIVNEKAICMYEKMVKFHVISHLKLRHCGSSSNISSLHYLNKEQLTKSLASLYDLYDANRHSDSIFEHEAEFRSLYVLLHLDSRSQPLGESLSLWFWHVPLPIIRSKEMCFARSILRSFRIGNYKHFIFSISAGASYLQYCIIEPYINEIRALSLSCINSVGYKLHPYPLVHLSRLLMMKESDLELFCNACGLETCVDETGNKLLPTKQASFHPPKGGFQSDDRFMGLEQFLNVT